MLDKGAVQEIASLAENKLHDIGGFTYSEKGLELVENPYQFPRTATLESLDGIARMIKAEIKRFNLPLFISVHSEDEIHVFSTYDKDNFKRIDPYQAKASLGIHFGHWMDQEQAIIHLKTCFIQNEDSEYVLKLLSSISQEDNVKSDDNGITQTVTAKTGIAMKINVTVKPIVKLRPYRTFLEVEQPESDFILRMGEGPRFALFEADGGMWKIQAKRNIKGYFEKELKAEIGAGHVIVTI